MTTEEKKTQELEELFDKWRDCEKCPLHKNRTNFVDGNGYYGDNTVMIIGEAPGFKEDKDGIPFVGLSGEILMDFLLAVHIKEEPFKSIQVARGRFIDYFDLQNALCQKYYFTNVLKCKLPEHEEPTKQCIEACKECLLQEIYIVDPILIIMVGKTAHSTLTKSRTGIQKVRGKVCYIEIPGHTTSLKYLGVPILPMAFLNKSGDLHIKGPLSRATYNDLILAFNLANMYKHVYLEEPLALKERDKDEG